MVERRLALSGVNPMAKTPDKEAPASVPLAGILTPIPGFNRAMDINVDRLEPAPRQMPYNEVPCDGLASRRSKQPVRTFEELAAATGPAPAPGYGLSLRSAMAGQCENDQFPLRTDAFGKQRT